MSAPKTEVLRHLLSVNPSQPEPAAGLTLLGALILIPAIFSRRDRGYPYVLFALLSTFAFLACAGGFGVTMYLFTVARDRFHAEGFSASYGPSVGFSIYTARTTNSRQPDSRRPAGVDRAFRHSAPALHRAQRRVRNMHGRATRTPSAPPCIHLLSRGLSCQMARGPASAGIFLLLIYAQTRMRSGRHMWDFLR